MRRKIVPTKAQSRDMEALRLRTTGWSMEAIADYQSMSVTAVANALRRAVAVMFRFAGNEQRVLEMQKLDEAEMEVWKVLKMTHWAYTNRGDLVYGPDGEPQKDSRIILEAIDRLLKIAERRAKLMGLDAPMRAEVLTIDSIDAEISRLENELAVVKQPLAIQQVAAELDAMTEADEVSRKL
jgi:hypothetical protein